MPGNWQLGAMPLSILVSNRSEENKRATADIVPDYDGDIRSLCMDLSAADAARKLFEWTEEHGIEIDILVCNAGIALWRLTTAEPGKRPHIVALHCTTPTLLCQLYGARMRTRGRRHTAHVVGYGPDASSDHRNLRRDEFYLRSFAGSLHDELTPYGISVSTVYPGAVDTPLYDSDEKRRKMMVRYGVMSTPEFIARKGQRVLFRERRDGIPGCFTKLRIAACRLLPTAAMNAIVRIPDVRRLL